MMNIKQVLGTKRSLSYLSAIATILMWSSAFPTTRYLLQYYSPGALMLIRFLLATAILIVVGIIRKIRIPKLKDMPLVLTYGVCGVFLYNFFFNTGTVNVASGVSSFIVATSPVFTLILARVLLKEIVNPACWIGVFLSFCGLMVVMFSQTTGFSLNIGVLLLVGAAISGSILHTSQRKMTETYTVLESVTYALVIGTLCMFVYIPDVIREFTVTIWSANIVMIYMSVFPAVLAYITWGYALSHAEKTTHVTVFLYLVPFLATLIGYFWLGETFSPWSMLGGIVIIAGMFLTNAFAKSGTRSK